MHFNRFHFDKERYAKCIEVSKQVRWDIDQDVIRGRNFDFSQKFLPDGISKINRLEFFTQEHYKQSIEAEENLSDLYKDIFLFHWKEETTHAMMDELEWPREDRKLSAEERGRAIDELIAIVVDVDSILQKWIKLSSCRLTSLKNNP
jgi:hypothetical protein